MTTKFLTIKFAKFPNLLSWKIPNFINIVVLASLIYGTNGILLKFCGLLRFSAKICSFLRFSMVFLCVPNAVVSRKAENLQKICENLRKNAKWLGLSPFWFVPLINFF